MYIDKDKLVLAFDLVRDNPKIDTDKLLTLLDINTPEHVKDRSQLTDEADTLLQLSIEPEEKEKRQTQNQKRSRKKWDALEDAELIRLHEQGFSNKEIAESLERSPEAISKRKTALAKEDLFEAKAGSKPYNNYERFVIRTLLQEHDAVIEIPEEKISRVANKLGRTTGAIKTQLYNMDKEIKRNNKKENAK